MASWLNIARDIVNRLNKYGSANEPAAASYPITIVDTNPEDSRSRNYLTLGQFDSIEYDSTHLWICQIDGAPSPFDKWMPAQSVQEPNKGVSVAPMSFGIEEINMLSNYNAVNLRVGLLDNDKAVLETWIRNWQKDCSAKDSKGRSYLGFRYLDDILKKIYITKYTWQKEKVYTHAYDVIPVGDILSEHTNEPGVKIINVNFAVFSSN